MKKGLWELSVAELDNEIANCKKILAEEGFIRSIADYQAVLEDERTERLIESDVLAGRFDEDSQKPDSVVE